MTISHRAILSVLFGLAGVACLAAGSCLHEIVVYRAKEKTVSVPVAGALGWPSEWPMEESSAGETPEVGEAAVPEENPFVTEAPRSGHEENPFATEASPSDDEADPFASEAPTDSENDPFAMPPVDSPPLSEQRTIRYFERGKAMEGEVVWHCTVGAAQRTPNGDVRLLEPGLCFS